MLYCISSNPVPLPLACNAANISLINPDQHKYTRTTWCLCYTSSATLLADFDVPGLVSIGKVLCGSLGSKSLEKPATSTLTISCPGSSVPSSSSLSLTLASNPSSSIAPSLSARGLLLVAAVADSALARLLSCQKPAPHISGCQLSTDKPRSPRRNSPRRTQPTTG